MARTPREIEEPKTLAYEMLRDFGNPLGAETTLEIDSPDPPDLVARVVRNAERGCFVMQALLNPVPVVGRTLLNGASIL
ncbi:MAG: hypothetical protein DME03_12270 [Candidatus Rokuibacteriota bacterium]|nr:MAG: hypothetical protein DME03_12270 [Candidatus Rokubacteria bacterium]